MADTGEDRDTIAAIATPTGRGGIGIVRLSGPDALALARPLLRSFPAEPRPAHAYYCTLIEPETGARLDEALVTFFAAPHSYTAEDVIEIAAHGSPVLLDHVLRLLLAPSGNHRESEGPHRSARLAAPGEFTERAFFSGRMDLTQAEAVRDLIDAQTLLQAQVAAQQLGGTLSRTVTPLKRELVQLIAILEAGIDFAEDDTPVLSDEAIVEKLLTIEQELAELEASFTQGRLLSEGVTLAIVGRPNVGKSSLFNRLLDRERAIVTAEPGTTRDTVAEQLSLNGVPLRLVDTAGLREAASEAERIGIARSREAFADAGCVLLVLDCTEPLNAEEDALLTACAGRPLLIALNKTDRLDRELRMDHESAASLEHFPYTSSAADLAVRGFSAGKSHMPQISPLYTYRENPLIPALPQLQSRAAGAALLPTSALTGAGIPALRTALETMLLGTGGVAPEAAMLTNLRQHTAVAAALSAIQTAARAGGSRLPHEIILLDLYTALHELDTFTGSTTADDVLNLIFSTFCIGK